MQVNYKTDKMIEKEIDKMIEEEGITEMEVERYRKLLEQRKAYETIDKMKKDIGAIKEALRDFMN